MGFKAIGPRRYGLLLLHINDPFTFDCMFLFDADARPVGREDHSLGEPCRNFVSPGLHGRPLDGVRFRRLPVPLRRKAIFHFWKTHSLRDVSDLFLLYLDYR